MVSPIRHSWVLQGAKFDLDFARNRYWGINHPQCPATGSGNGRTVFMNSSQSAPIWIQYPDGVVRQFGLYTPPIIPSLGLMTEAGSTNYSLWSRDLTNIVWTKLNLTVSKNQVGADNSSNGACLLTATADGGTCLQTITLASTSVLTSCLIKRVSGSGTVEMTTDGGLSWTNVTLTSSFSRVFVPRQTIANPIVGFRLGTSGDSITVDFFQCETAVTQATPSISMTVTSGSTIGKINGWFNFQIGTGNPNNGARLLNDVLFSGHPFSFVIKYCGNPVDGGGLTIGTDATGVPLGIANGGANGTPAIYAGISTPNNGNIGIGNWNKQAGKTNGFGSVQCLNGGDITAPNTGSRVPSMGTARTHGSFGNNGSGTTGVPMNGYISRVTFWDKEISDGQLQQFTLNPDT